jgi:NADH-quinone oxidoreductase subunit A
VILPLSLRVGKYASDPEKLSFYKCGFDPDEDARNVFDVRFYFVAIIFKVSGLKACIFSPCALLFFS